MPNQQDIEQLLRDIPLETPADQSAASDMLQIFINLRNAAFEGGGVSIPGTTTAFSIPALISQMRQGNYVDVAVTLVSVTGDAAGAFSFLTTAAVEAGAISGTSALASAGVVGGLLSEAAGPAALAAVVLVETFRIPSNVSENNGKLYYLSDASGILTSWMFNMPEISPHSRLMQRARTGGYCRTDISEQCRIAHRKVHELWVRNYRGNTTARRQARQSANNNWEQYWLQVGGAMEQRLAPSPTGIGVSWIRGLIRETTTQIRNDRFDAEQQRLAQRQRRAAGGYYVGDLFVPDR